MCLVFNWLEIATFSSSRQVEFWRRIELGGELGCVGDGLGWRRIELGADLVVDELAGDGLG